MSRSIHPVVKHRTGLFSLLKPYRGSVVLIFVLSILSNGSAMVLPRLIGVSINDYAAQTQVNTQNVQWLLASCVGVFVFTVLQNLVQVYTSERVAYNLRSRLSQKISEQSYQFVQQTEPSKLLTNLTADVDSIKSFVADAIAGLLASVLLILGTTAILLWINWRLALAILGIVPLIGLNFAMVIRTLRPIFRQTREVTDSINKLIQESVLGAALIRVVSGQQVESDRFETTNSLARNLGLSILARFAGLIPIVNMLVQSAAIIILGLGGKFVLQGSMSIGDLASFNGYLSMLIFPIFVIGFMNTMIAQASAAYERLLPVLDAIPGQEEGRLDARLAGHVEAKDLCLTYGERRVIDSVSLSLKPGTRTAVIGPTAAGKTQLLQLLTGLLQPDSGTIRYDGHPLEEYSKTCLHRQVALVFQESVLFNLSLRENVAFAQAVEPDIWQKAIQTAELGDLIERLPQGAETMVSERGTSLSGGQKQRLMLARALALDPAILLLDDFTARVDPTTEAKILANLQQNYPQLTLLAVTQRVATVQDYDHIILMMEGKLIAEGTHQQLLDSCPEYMQIFHSQKSTQDYELSTH